MVPVTADRAGMTQAHRSRPRVVSWADAPAVPFRISAWHAWLHGNVGVIHADDRDLLVVPMAEPPERAKAMALRLYQVGAVAELA